MGITAENRIIDLWPTIFLIYSPDGHDRYQDDLAFLAEQSANSDFLLNEDSAAAWLKSEINDAANAYLERWAEAEVTDFETTSHLVVNDHGDYHPLTNHPDSYLSGIYYVTVPTDIRDSHHRNDVKSSAISFSDPRFSMNMNAIAKDPHVDWHKIVRPKAGTLIIWPSFIDFFIHPNLSTDKQVSVHFKILLGRGA